MSKNDLRPRVRVFRQLLDDFAANKLGETVEVEARCARFGNLLNTYCTAREHVLTSQSQLDSLQYSTIDQLLRSYRAKWDEWQADQRGTAERFNALEVLGIEGRELCHSRVIAWLLDRNSRRYGTHSQGALGFRLFLEQLHLPPDYADGRYTVRTEVPGSSSRIDLEVAEPGKFVIHIENKIWANEGPDQTRREWDDLQSRAASLGLTGHGPHVLAYFLTPEGTAPLCKHFQVLSWRHLTLTFERFALIAEAAEVRLFASHYAKALRRFILEAEKEVEANGEKILK